MKIAIRYHSKSGNTKKIADAISEVTGVPAETVDVPIEEDVDTLFLGSAVYAAGIDNKVKTFIAALTPGKVKNVVNFSTAALMPSTYGMVAKLLNAKGIPLNEKGFHCRGKFKFAHVNRPNEQDIENVKTFTKEILKG